MICALCQRGELNALGQCATCGAETCPDCDRPVMLGETCECGLDALYCEACGARCDTFAAVDGCRRCGCDPAVGRLPDGAIVDHRCGWVGSIDTWRANDAIASVVGAPEIHRACPGCGSHIVEASLVHEVDGLDAHGMPVATKE